MKELKQHDVSQLTHRLRNVFDSLPEVGMGEITIPQIVRQQLESGRKVSFSDTQRCVLDLVGRKLAKEVTSGNNKTATYARFHVMEEEEPTWTPEEERVDECRTMENLSEWAPTAIEIVEERMDNLAAAIYSLKQKVIELEEENTELRAKLAARKGSAASVAERILRELEELES